MLPPPSAGIETTAMTMGADVLVVDASAAISMVRGEEAESAVRRVMDRAGPGHLFVPEILWVEVTNVLVRRYGQPYDTVLEAVAELDGLGLRTVQSSRGGLLSSVALMVEHGLSAYDAIYLALAESLDAQLLTLDERLAAAAGNRAVSLDPGEVHEPRTPYKLEPWITWGDAAQYLEAVRRVTLDEARA
jgi:predicted nucleic acid-binding protein